MSLHMYVYECPINCKPFWIATVHTEDGIFTHGGVTASIAAAMLLDVLGAKYHVTSVDQDLKLEKLAGVVVGVKSEPPPAFVSPSAFYPGPTAKEREARREAQILAWAKKLPKGATREQIVQAIKDHNNAAQQRRNARKSASDRKAKESMAQLAKQRGEAA